MKTENTKSPVAGSALPGSVHYPVMEISLPSGKVSIKELSWPDALDLYSKMMDQSRFLMGEGGQIAMTPEKFVNALNENVELGKWLVLKATGKDETWLDERSLSEVLDVMTAAAELNVGIIVTRLKKARGRFQELLAGDQSPKINT